MRINLQAKNIDLTDPIKEYIEKRITNLGRFLVKMEERSGEVVVTFEVEKTTNHHKSGDIFNSTCSINIDGQTFRASADKPDLYESIDAVKETLFREIRRAKGKRQALFKRGATKIKKILKGIKSFKK